MARALRLTTRGLRAEHLLGVEGQANPFRALNTVLARIVEPGIVDLYSR